MCQECTYKSERIYETKFKIRILIKFGKAYKCFRIDEEEKDMTAFGQIANNEIDVVL